MKKLVLMLVAICVVSFSIFGLSLGRAAFSADERARFVLTDSHEEIVSVQDIQEIRLVGWRSSKVTILPVDSDEITARLETRYTSSGKLPALDVSIVGSTLNIQRIAVNRPAIGIMVYFESELTVYVPAAYAHDLHIFGGSGSNSITGLSLNQFTYEGTSGNLSAEGLTVNKAKIQSGSGSVRLYKFMGDIECTTGSGSSLIEYNIYENNRVNVQAGSGSVTIRLPDSAGYSLDAVTSSGRITTYFPISTESRHRVNADVGDGDGSINIETRSGNINITR